MTQYFVDSSALVKRYMRESGSDWMRSITDSQSGHNILIADITSIEIMSGIMRRKREGELPEQTASALRQLLEIHVNRDYTVIRLTDSIVQRAKDLLEVLSTFCIIPYEESRIQNGSDTLNILTP